MKTSELEPKMKHNYYFKDDEMKVQRPVESHTSEQHSQALYFFAFGEHFSEPHIWSLM